MSKVGAVARRRLCLAERGASAMLGSSFGWLTGPAAAAPRYGGGGGGRRDKWWTVVRSG